MNMALRRGYMKLDDGWIAPFNGYQYKVTTNFTSWDVNRQICRNVGGDLIGKKFQEVCDKSYVHSTELLPFILSTGYNK